MENAKEKPYKVGYYTGTFDIFHDGHLGALITASSMCEKLIVGVSTDETVMEYKHHLPVIPFNQRIKIIDNLQCVFRAIPQYDLYNKVDVCKAIGADVLFSCDEYLPETYEDLSALSQKQLDGIERWEKFSEEANANGIDVVFLERSEGISSTLIKERICSSGKDEDHNNDDEDILNSNIQEEGFGQ